nr:MAG: putative coat protein [Yunnan alphaflexivirus]
MAQPAQPAAAAQPAAPAAPGDPVRPAQPAVPPLPPRQPGGPSQPDELVPDEAALQTLATTVEVNKTATRATVTAILQEVKAKSSGATVTDLVSLAWACYHNGSSRYTTLESTAPCGLKHSEMKDLVENHCTLRQFCMFYAKVIYNMGREQKIPPANWAQKGYREETKFAAFDFFNGVLSDAAVMPSGGLKHHPSPEERKAQQLNAKMAILESREQDNQFSTRGNLLAMQQVRAPPTAPLITFQ